MKMKLGNIARVTGLGLALFWAGIPSAWTEITFETGDGPHELYFLWQGSFTQAGAQSGNLLDMPAFMTAYNKDMIEMMEILEVRELDTDQIIDFNYVTPRKASPPKMREVVWYYPNPNALKEFIG
ncbi:MAG: hypothetical protein FJ395_10885 [Verrucomicrobia bacterium]|nr:hypothetical protein [Verrucomicrobiota bacterium]